MSDQRRGGGRGPPPGRGGFDGGRGGGRGGGPQGGTPRPPPGITDDQAVAKLHDALRHMTLSGTRTPVPGRTPEGRSQPARAKRPNFGEAGRMLQVYVNHFVVDLVGNPVAYHYDVSIVPRDEGGAPPPVGSRNANPGQQLNTDVLLALSRMQNWEEVWVFDGRKNLYSSRVDFLPVEEVSTLVQLQEPGRRTLRQFTVTTKQVAAHDVRDLVNFARGQTAQIPRDALQALDIALRHRSMLDPAQITIRRSIFVNDARYKEPLHGIIEAWFGYQQALKPCQFGLTLSIDTAVTGFLVDWDLVKLVAHLTGRSPQARQPLTTAEQRDVTKSIRHVRIMTNHRPGQRKYVIDGISNCPAAEERFFCDDAAVNREISVAEYFARQLNKPLQFPHLHCIKVRARDGTRSIPPEFCKVIPGQRRMRLDPAANTEIIRKAAQNPKERMAYIQDVANTTGYQNDPTVAAFGMRISTAMLQVEARVLPPPVVSYKAPTNMDVGPRGAWNTVGATLLRPMPLTSWAVLCVTDQRNVDYQGETSIHQFVEELVRMLERHGLGVQDKRPPILYGQRNMTVAEMLTATAAAAQQQSGRRAELLLVLLEGREYREVKRAGDHELGIATQCFRAEKARVGRRQQPKDRGQYLENLTLKINAKLGGTNQKLGMQPQQSMPVIGGKPFMIIGADVTHPAGRAEENAPSIAAVVGSVDKFACRYAARICMQTGRVDLILNMKQMVKELLMEFYQRNNQKRPEAIVVYRDGVSEGQFDQVLFHEYAAIRSACEEMGDAAAGYTPPITFIVCQKRHNTRMFPMDARDADRSGNVLPGTVVDRGIAHPSEFDFFLVSQAGIQGTSKPAHYHVLVDENGFGADGVQLQTYWLCYTYCRCARSVGLVPAAYYAHLAAFRGREMLDHADSSSDTSGAGAAPQFASINVALNNSMFYV